ncbi:hypothetical protein D3C72_1457290 [compost metagenome]
MQAGQVLDTAALQQVLPAQEDSPKQIAARGGHDDVGGQAAAVQDFGGDGLVALDAVRVCADGRIQIIGARECAVVAAQVFHVRPTGQAVFEGAELGAEALHGFALQGWAVAGDGDIGLQAGGGAIGGDRDAGIAAGSRRYAGGAGQPCPRYQLGRHAVLVATGGVGAFTFKPKLADAFGLGQVQRFQAGRVAFTQRDGGQDRQGQGGVVAG